MNIAVLSRGSNLYSTKSLLNAGEAANHTMEVIHPDYCKLLLDEGKPMLQYFDETIDDRDAVIPRIGTSNTFFGTTLVRHFEAMGVFSTVSSNAINISRDKWSCSQVLTKHKIPIPKTILFHNLVAESVVEEFNQKPVIIKLLEGTHGQGVILTTSVYNTIATLETLLISNQKCIVQEYIEESKGADVRVIVVDNTVVAAMHRKCKTGDFRSNLHRGGTSKIAKLTAEEESVALRAARALKLGVCGVDLLQSERGPLVLEVNSTPGLEGIETTTGVDVSKKIISFIERNKY